MKTLFTSKQFILFLMLSCMLSASKMMAQPMNDLIENAIDLAKGPLEYVEPDVDFSNATFTNDGGQQGCDIGVAGVWYKFTATAEGEVNARVWMNSASIVMFYSAPNGNVTSGQELTHVDQPNNECDPTNYAYIQTTIGVTYYLFMKNNITSEVIINAGGAFATPSNDLIENAIDTDGQGNFIDEDVHFLMATANNDGGQLGCDAQGTPALWYKFTADVGGQATVQMSTSAQLSVIVFYSSADENATSGSELIYVNQLTNPCSAGNSASILTVAGLSYYVLVSTIEPWADVNVDLSNVLEVSDNTIEGFTFYPNPVVSEINLRAKNNIDEVAIYSILGQKVYAENPNASNKKIELSFLESGIYIMNVSSEGKRASYKLIKK